MKKLFNAIAGAGLAVTMVLGAAAPAKAVTLQEFNTSYSDIAKVHGLVNSITTEIFRNIRLGQTQQAACIYENFMPMKDHTNEFAIIVGALIESKNPANESVESYIAGTIKHICGTSAGADVSAKAPTESILTSVKDFFALTPNVEDAIKVSLMALDTQALRAANDGHPEYSQCIMDKLVNPTPTGAPAAGFLELFRQLGANRTSPVAIEKFYIGAINHYCGEEPLTPPADQQAAAKPDAKAPVPN